MPQQNSPVPSPYAPQSPAGYMPYSHPSSYTTHPQIQQGKKLVTHLQGVPVIQADLFFLFTVLKIQTKTVP